jgi:hypothetical protein
VFLREGYAVYVTSHGVLVVVSITSFLLSARRLEFLLFDRGTGALLQSQGECWVLVHCGGAVFLAPAEQWITTQWNWDSNFWKERCDSSAGRCSLKLWDSVYSGEQGI